MFTIRQRARADTLLPYIDVSFSWVCPIIDNEFRHNIVKIVCSDSDFGNVMTKFMINNSRDAWKIDVNLLNGLWKIL